MAKKMTDEELNNASGGGGCGYVSECPHCGVWKDGKFWNCTFTNPETGKKSNTWMCDKCAKECVNDPRYSNWTLRKKL